MKTKRQINDTSDFQNQMCEQPLHQALLTERSFPNSKGSSQLRANPGGQGSSELQEKPPCGEKLQDGRQGSEPPCRERSEERQEVVATCCIKNLSGLCPGFLAKEFLKPLEFPEG